MMEEDITDEGMSFVSEIVDEGLVMEVGLTLDGM